jgi:hypothetical protein
MIGCSGFNTLAKSEIGTFETCRQTLTMSAYRCGPEVAGRWLN